MALTGYMSYKKLYQTISVLSRQRTADTDGGYTDAWAGTGVIVKGVIANATTRELMLAQQMQYPITHSVIVEGAPVAQIGQRIALATLTSGQTVGGARQFQVQSVENPGELGAYTIYQTEEIR